MAGLPIPLSGLRRTAEPVWSTRLQTFLTVLNFYLLSGYNWKWWLSHQVLGHEAYAFNTQNLARWKRWVFMEKLAIWWNSQVDVQKLVGICGYELPTNLQNFMQKDLTEVKIFQAVFWNTLYIGEKYDLAKILIQLTSQARYSKLISGKKSLSAHSYRHLCLSSSRFHLYIAK